MDNIEENQKASQAVFSRVRNTELRTPPYMKTRILAHLRSAQSTTHRLRFWRVISIFSSAFGIILALYLIQPKSSSEESAFEVAIHQAISIKVELNELQGSEVALAEIDLPEGVEFYSEKHPEIREKRNLAFAWENLAGKAHLPFVVTGQVAGAKDVRVRFYNAQNVLVAEKVVQIQFVEPVRTGSSV